MDNVPALEAGAINLDLSYLKALVGIKLKCFSFSRTAS